MFRTERASLTPSSKQCCFLSEPLEIATTVNPNLAAYWMATCPNPPTLFDKNHYLGGVKRRVQQCPPGGRDDMLARALSRAHTGSKHKTQGIKASTKRQSLTSPFPILCTAIYRVYSPSDGLFIPFDFFVFPLDRPQVRCTHPR